MWDAAPNEETQKENEKKANENRCAWFHFPVFYWGITFAFLLKSNRRDLYTSKFISGDWWNIFKRIQNNSLTQQFAFNRLLCALEHGLYFRLLTTTRKNISSVFTINIDSFVIRSCWQRFESKLIVETVKKTRYEQRWCCFFFPLVPLS